MVYPLFTILHDPMFFQVQIQDCCFRSSVVWILSIRVSLLKMINFTSQWNVTLLCFDMVRNDRGALWFCDLVFLSLVFLSLLSLSSVPPISSPPLWNMWVWWSRGQKEALFYSKWMDEGREREKIKTSLSIFMVQIQTIKFPLQPLRPIFHFTMNSVWAMERIHYAYEQKHPQNYCHKLKSEHWVIPI